jgi:hypothetical protein
LGSTIPRGTSVSGIIFEGGSSGFLLLLSLIRVTVEEEINHDVPRSSAGRLTLETENLTAEEPVDETNGVLGLVVGGDDTIYVANLRVSVTDGNGGDVGIGSLKKGLAISVRVSDDDQSGLNELGLDLIGEGTRGETTGKRLGTSEGGKLQDGTLTVGARSNNANVRGLLNSNDHTSSENDLLVGLLKVDDVDSVVVALVDIATHLGVDSLGTQMDVASKHLCNVILRRNVDVNV